MNKQRSFAEQLPQFLIVAIGSWMLFNYFFNPQKNAATTPPRAALSIAQAFQGIDPNRGAAITEIQALAEKKKLQADIDKNPSDALSYWSRLRVALLQQYVLKDLETQTRSSGFLGFGPKVKYFPAYEEIIKHGAGDAVDAQAVYQAGDKLWRDSIQNGARPSQEAATTLESLVHKGRGSSAFLDQQILVPAQVDPAKVPVIGVPEDGFKTVKVSDLRGTPQSPNPQGIPDRVNFYYSDKPLYKLFDSVVNLFGANPTFSYGLAVLFFAVLTRCVVQPLTKRQYDSMKGMAVIAPEMKKIQERYKGKTEGDAQVKMMKEIRELQQRHGVNPALGCGLAALQMPVFFLFVYPLIQNYESKMELTGASFLWISSLARPDMILLVLYGISMFLSFRLSSTPPTDDMQRQQQMIMSFVMPFVFPFFILSYPSAFTMYWMTYNAMSTLFQWRMMKAADPKKNLIKSLMGSDLRVANATADAVPSRPNDNPASLDSSSNGFKDSSSNGNGTNNGHTNGKVKSSPNGIVLTPLDNNGDQNTKKKKKR